MIGEEKEWGPEHVQWLNATNLFRSYVVDAESLTPRRAYNPEGWVGLVLLCLSGAR